MNKIYFETEFLKIENRRNELKKYAQQEREEREGILNEIGLELISEIDSCTSEYTVINHLNYLSNDQKSLCFQKLTNAKNRFKYYINDNFPDTEISHAVNNENFKFRRGTNIESLLINQVLNTRELEYYYYLCGKFKN